MWFVANLLRVGRFCPSVAVQVAVKPIELPVQALDKVLGLARSCQIVVLPRKEHDLRGHSVMLQRPEPLLALLDGNAEIIVGMENERWRADVARIF
jgi:hypothetical protein